MGVLWKEELPTCKGLLIKGRGCIIRFLHYSTPSESLELQVSRHSTFRLKKAQKAVWSLGSEALNYESLWALLKALTYEFLEP